MTHEQGDHTVDTNIRVNDSLDVIDNRGSITRIGGGVAGIDTDEIYKRVALRRVITIADSQANISVGQITGADLPLITDSHWHGVLWVTLVAAVGTGDPEAAWKAPFAFRWLEDETIGFAVGTPVFDTSSGIFTESHAITGSPPSQILNFRVTTSGSGGGRYYSLIEGELYRIQGSHE